MRTRPAPKESMPMVKVNSVVWFSAPRTMKLYSRTSGFAANPTYWTFMALIMRLFLVATDDLCDLPDLLVGKMRVLAGHRHRYQGSTALRVYDWTSLLYTGRPIDGVQFDS
jgi:hypothetical protein